MFDRMDALSVCNMYMLELTFTLFTAPVIVIIVIIGRTGAAACSGVS